MFDIRWATSIGIGSWAIRWPNMASRYFTALKERKVGPGGPRPKDKQGKDAATVKDKQGPYGSPFERSRKGRYA